MAQVRNPLPSFARLHELFEYKEGELYWKKKPSKYANNVAGEKAGMTASQGYWRIKVDGSTHFAHRLIYAMHNNGNCPDFVDHIDGDHMNNTIENLREATIVQNAQNAKLHATNKSGAKNVSWLPVKNCWRVLVSINKKRKCWLVKDFELAELVATEARDKFHGKYANHGFTTQGV